MGPLSKSPEAPKSVQILLPVANTGSVVLSTLTLTTDPINNNYYPATVSS